MRAGPGADYPVIAHIRGGSAVNVYGCIADYSWCDSSRSEHPRMDFHNAAAIPVWRQPGPAPRVLSLYFGAPTVSFDFGYWDRYYYDRPFYS